MEDHSQISDKADHNQQEALSERSVRTKRMNLMLMLVVYLMLVLPGLWIYLHIPGEIWQTSDTNEGYTTLGIFVIGGLVAFSTAFFWFVKWRLALLAKTEDDGLEQFDQPQVNAETPIGVSNARIGYLIAFILTILSLFALVAVGAINGNGQVHEDLLPMLYFGLIGLVIGFVSLYFGVRCGHCSTGLLSLMRSDSTGAENISYSGDQKEMFRFMISSRCTKCGIRRR